MSQATVRIPTPLRTLTGGNDEVKAEGATVGDLIDNLEKSYPGMRERLLDDKGRPPLREHLRSAKRTSASSTA